PVDVVVGDNQFGQSCIDECNCAIEPNRCWSDLLLRCKEQHSDIRSEPISQNLQRFFCIHRHKVIICRRVPGLSEEERHTRRLLQELRLSTVPCLYTPMGPNESDGSRLVAEPFVLQKPVSRKLAGSVSIGRHSACDSKENM